MLEPPGESPNAAIYMKAVVNGKPWTASKVIRDEKDVVPGCLRSRCGCMPLGSRAREAELDPETEWAAR